MTERKKQFTPLRGEITTWRDPYDEGFSTTRAKKIQFLTGLTVLVGCNGSGKTTLLHNIEDTCRKNRVPFKSFDNLSDGDSTSISSLIFRGNMELAANMFCASEGERISQNLGIFAHDLGAYVSKQEEPMQEFWILLDACDSGLSIDNVLELKDFFRTLQADLSKTRLYIIVAANEYEMASGEACLDVISGNYISFKDYDDFKKFIIRSRNRKDNRMERARRKMEKLEKED